MKRENNQLLLHLPLISIILLFALANVLQIKQLWGLNFLKFLDISALYIILPLIGIVAIPSVSSRIHKLLTSLSEAGRSKLLFAAITISILTAVLGFAWPSATHLLGDAHLRLNQITGGKLFLPTEILDFFLHSILYSKVMLPLGHDIQSSYHVISAICGLIFTFGIFRLARYLAPNQLWVSFLLMISSGILVLFLGYVESYSLIAAMLPYIFLAGLKAYDGESSKINYLALCAVGALIHSVALILFLPGLIVLFFTPVDDRKGDSKKTTLAMIAVIMLLVVAAYIGRYMEIGTIDRYLMPFLTRPEFEHGIFTANHYLNIFNWLYLAGLPALLLALYVIARSSLSEICSNRRTLYALWIIIPSVLFVFFFIPQLGGPADWDLFALPVFLLVPSLITMYLSRSKGTLPIHSIPVALLSLVLTFSFAAINANVVTSVERFAEVIEVSKFKNLTKQYRLLVITTQSRPEVRDRQLEFLHKAWEQPPYTKTDSVGVLSDLGTAYLEKGDQQRSYQYIARAVQVDSLELKSHQALSHYLRRFGTSEDLLKMAQLVERRFSHDAQGMMTAGIVYQDAGAIAKGGDCLARAYELDNENYYILLTYGSHLLRSGDYQRSLDVLKRVIERNETSFQGYYMTAVAHKNLGQTNKAKEYATKAAVVQSSNAEAKLLLDLEKSLR